MSRVSLKIVGASGQGINSIGEIVGKALKRSGYCVFGYREYPSLIKGGHASYQIDVSSEVVRSTETKVNILVALNHHGLEQNLGDLKDGGIVIHDTPDWEFSKDDQTLLRGQKIEVLYLPVEEILERLGAKPILSNVLFSAFVWAALGQSAQVLKDLVAERFRKKKDLLDLNMRCIDEGYSHAAQATKRFTVQLPPPNQQWKDHLLLTGSNAMGLGAVHAGVRLYAGYPMTPSSPLLGYVADLQNETGMVMKQAEDEITAAQLVSGAMFMGTRALTATAGGGFDLMSETVSMNGMIENPTVFALGQRPGPATGLPTWTCQGDLLMAVSTSHGEFPRCVLSVSDSQDAFDLLTEAFNLAEEFQTVVIVLFDKQVAEALYTQSKYDLKKAKIRRGKLVTAAKELARVRGTDRYDPHVPDGISPRWLPGVEAATYCAQADEHNADGTVDETSENTMLQFTKRLKKMEALKRALPEPELFGAQDPDVLLVGWGSTKGTVLDVMERMERRIGYLHYTYLWPLRTERFEKLCAKARKTILVEGNCLGQLGMLIKQQCGIEISEKILKYDGRPFFFDELLEELQQRLSQFLILNS